MPAGIAHAGFARRVVGPFGLQTLMGRHSVAFTMDTICLKSDDRSERPRRLRAAAQFHSKDFPV